MCDQSLCSSLIHSQCCQASSAEGERERGRAEGWEEQERGEEGEEREREGKKSATDLFLVSDVIGIHSIACGYHQYCRISNLSERQP